jgi:ribosomal protein S18 acetylase RimI-like enzyme
VGAERRRCGGVADPPLISDAEPDDADALRELFREYAASLGEYGWLDGFDEELAALPGGYEALLVARVGDEIVGCVALKRLPDGTCELKRLYVRPSARRSGTGRALAEAAVARGRELGCGAIRLDTLPSMTAARTLYLSLGFRPTERYNDNPIPGVLFFELQL